MHMPKKLYFAYGSNLNRVDFKKWCKENRFPSRLLRFHSIARLPDFDLGFNYNSTTRGGGVLNILPRTGQLVPGALYEIDDKGKAALNQKEGAPKIYKQVDVTVINNQGEEIRAFTYQLCPDRVKDYVKPTAEYLDIVRQGLENLGLDSNILESVAKNKTSACPDAFLFYGTLMRGQSRFPQLEKFGVKCTLLAKMFGRLLDLGEYPGLVDIATTDSMIHGDFVRLNQPEKAIQLLDSIEGFQGFGKPNSLYRRTWTNVDVGDARIRGAWTYCLSANCCQATPIPSGDWREHLGQKNNFMKQLVQLHAQGREAELAKRIVTSHPFHIKENVESQIQSLLPLDCALMSGELAERTLAQASGKWMVY